MRRKCLAVVISVLVLLGMSASCRKPPPPPTVVIPPVTMPPEWDFKKGAIDLRLKADPELNLYQGSPHTLVLCVYHLKDPNAFNQTLEEKEGLSKLLECTRFDPSFSFAKRLVVQPGQELVESLDRAEGTKYVALVAGYYYLEKDRAMRFFSIPIVKEQKENTIYQRPGQLTIDLYLGPQEIRDVKGN